MVLNGIALVWLLVLVLVLVGMGIGTLGRRIEVKSFEKPPIDSGSPTPETFDQTL